MPTLRQPKLRLHMAAGRVLHKLDAAALAVPLQRLLIQTHMMLQEKQLSRTTLIVKLTFS
jgi:hypothetical protein